MHNQTMNPSDNLTSINTIGIVLSGGAGSRMGGCDKGLQLYEESTLIETTITRLQPQVTELLVSANRNLEKYRSLGVSVVCDANSQEYQGPMAGVAAALNSLSDTNSNELEYDFAMVCPCDAPMLPTDLRQRLLTGLNKHRVAVAHDGKRSQNLHCLIHPSLWQNLIEEFNKGERAMHRWQRRVGCSYVDFSDQASGFSNFNTLQSLKKT